MAGASSVCCVSGVLLSDARHTAALRQLYQSAMNCEGSSAPRLRSAHLGLPCAGLLLAMVGGVTTLAQGQDCPLDAEQLHFRVEVTRLSDADRCRISEVVAQFSTLGTIGPRSTPIDWELYGFLLDHPPLAASLVRAIGLASYEISAHEHNVWSANDGEGTQGLATLLYQDRMTRIYAMKGYHDGMLLGRLYADAVLFMRLRPGKGNQSVESAIIVYTKLDKRHWMLNALIPVVGPLISHTVTRIVGKAFTAAHALGIRIADNPEKVLHIAASLGSSHLHDLQTLTLLLRTRGQHDSSRGMVEWKIRLQQGDQGNQEWRRAG